MTDDVKDLSPALMSRSRGRINEAEKELEELMRLELEAQNAGEDEGVQEIEQKPTEPKEPVKEVLTAEEETYKKRYGDLRRHTEKIKKDLTDEIDRLKSGSNTVSLPKTEEEVAAWVEKYPDVAAIVESLADKKAKERDSDLDKRLSQIEQMRDEVEKEKAQAAIIKLHPDFNEISQDDAFHDWVEKQPKWVQDSVYDNLDASTVARALDLYKLDNGIKKIAPDKNAALAINTRTRVTPQEDEKSDWFSESQVQKMSDKEFAEKAEQIEKAQREGKFKYDITRKGR